MSIVTVILELSILDIQTMLLFMVKTHLGQVKTMLQPPQAQYTTMIHLHILVLICIATTGILVSPMIANTTAIIATAEVEPLIL